MSDVLMFAFAAVVGFGVAAVLAGVYRALTTEPVDFNAPSTSVPGRVTGFLFRIVVGPAIIVRQALASAQAGETPQSWALAGVMVAMVWSGVLGVVIINVVSRFGA